MTENWLPVPEFAAYDISDEGRIRSYWTKGKFKYIADTPQRILCPSANADGYLQVRLTNGKRHCFRYIAAIVLHAFVSPRPAGMLACHNNSKPKDNRLVNLRWDTPSGNMADMDCQTQAIRAFNMRERRRKLTDDQVIDIRLRYAMDPRLTLRALADECRVHSRTIGRLCRGERYAHLGGPRTKKRYLSGQRYRQDNKINN